MRSRFSPARCCCGGGSARLVVHAVRPIAVEYGTVKIYRSGGSVLGEYDLATDLVGAGALRHLPVSLPTPSVSNCRVVLDLPRCKQYDSGYTVNLSANVVAGFKITEMNLPLIHGYIGFVDPLDEYCAVSNLAYPQVRKLTLTDSVLGEVELDYDPLVTNASAMGGWRGAMPKGLLLYPGPMVTPGVITYKVAGAGTTDENVEKLAVRIDHEYESGGLANNGGYGFWQSGLPPVVQSNTVWWPTGGAVSLATNTVKGYHPRATGNPPSTVDVAITAAE